MGFNLINRVRGLYGKISARQVLTVRTELLRKNSLYCCNDTEDQTSKNQTYRKRMFSLAAKSLVTFSAKKVNTIILNPLTRVCVSRKLTDLPSINSLFTRTFASSEQSNPYVWTDGRAENLPFRSGKLRTGCSTNEWLTQPYNKYILLSGADEAKCRFTNTYNSRKFVKSLKASRAKSSGWLFCRYLSKNTKRYTKK